MTQVSRSSGRRPTFGAAAAVLVCVACLLPFADKAFTIDDPLFLWAAQHIQQHPTDPYGFVVNWYGWPMAMSDVTKNPPLACYFLALAAALFGWSEIALHLAFLLPAAGAAWGTYRLAEDLCGRPLLATLAAILTPVFLVSSSNVMCDTMMLCLWIWSIVCWRRGLDRPGWSIVAGVSISLCALTKYFGVSLIPLLLVYTLIARRRQWRRLTALLIPVVVLGLYQWLTWRMYGRGLLLDAAGFSLGSQGDFSKRLLRPLIGLAFTGGCLSSLLFYLPLLWSWRWLLAGVGLAVALLVLGQLAADPLLGEHGGDGAILLQTVLLLLGGIAAIALAVADVRRRRDADAWLLFLWSAGTLAFAVGVNWVINGRSLLPLAPAVGILIARRLDLLHGPQGKAKVWREAWPLVPAAVLALVVATADCRQADADRAAANAVADGCAGQPGRVWFEGHWGFQYYLERRGGTHTNMEHYHFCTGDFLVLPENNYGVLFAPDPDTIRDFRTIEQPLSLIATTMTERRGSGFYSHIHGPLPFVLGPAASVRYRVVRFLTEVETSE